MDITDNNVATYPDGFNYVQNELLPVPDEAKESFMRTIMLFLVQY